MLKNVKNNFLLLKIIFLLFLKAGENNFYLFFKNYYLFHFIFKNYFEITMGKQC